MAGLTFVRLCFAGEDDALNTPAPIVQKTETQTQLYVQIIQKYIDWISKTSSYEEKRRIACMMFETLNNKYCYTCLSNKTRFICTIIDKANELLEEIDCFPSSDLNETLRAHLSKTKRIYTAFIPAWKYVGSININNNNSHDLYKCNDRDIWRYMKNDGKWVYSKSLKDGFSH